MSTLIPFPTSGFTLIPTYPGDGSASASEADIRQNIPTPPSIPDYESREFHANSTSFSSFAELIGIVRSLDFVLAERWQTGTEAANRVCANADTTILAWLLLLPPQKQSLVRGDGSVDQLLFRAHMLVYTYVLIRTLLQFPRL
jgi:hypothetical protein